MRVERIAIVGILFVLVSTWCSLVYYGIHSDKKSRPDVFVTHGPTPKPIKYTFIPAPGIKTVDGHKLTDSQYHYLMLAKQVGEPYNLSMTLMSILWQETKAGKLGPVGDMSLPFGKRSYGIMQVKLATARHVIDTYPDQFSSFSDAAGEEIIAKLITNPKFDLEIACGYLRLLQGRGLDWRQMVTAYNQGYRGSLDHDPDTFSYTQDVIQTMTEGTVAKIQEMSK